MVFVHRLFIERTYLGQGGLYKILRTSLVLFQPRKTSLFITEILLMGRKESNQTNKYLGMELQWSLSWNLHIGQTVKKANRRPFNPFASRADPDQAALVRAMMYQTPQLIVRNKKIIFLFINQNICCGYSKESSRWDGSFEQPKHMLKLLGKKIFTILR